MPRPASHSQDDALQGSLFGEPEPARIEAEPEAATGELSDAELGADAAARPRSRRNTHPGTTATDTEDASKSSHRRNNYSSHNRRATSLNLATVFLRIPLLTLVQ